MNLHLTGEDRPHYIKYFIDSRIPNMKSALRIHETFI